MGMLREEHGVWVREKEKKYKILAGKRERMMLLWGAGPRREYIIKIRFRETYYVGANE
jgi:hypothetical protein